MFGKSLKASFMLVLVCSIFLGACQNSSGNNKSKENKDEKVTIVEQAAKQFTKFKKMGSDELLKDSIEIPRYEGYEFTPTRMNDNGILFGVSVNEKDRHDVYATSLNLETKTYKKLKKISIKTDYPSFGFDAVSNDFIVITEIIVDKGLYSYYLYDLKTDKYEKIHEFEQMNVIVDSKGIFQDDVLYMDFTKDGKIFNLYKYDIKDKKMDMLVKENCSSPIVVGSKMYYIEIDNEKLITHFSVYDLKTKQTKRLIERTEDEGWINYIETDGTYIYLFTQQPTGETYCYKYDIKENKLLPYIENSSMSSPMIYENFMTFWGENRSDDRNKPTLYLFDMAKEINYVYDHSLMNISKKGIVWNKFIKDERKLGKGEIFKKGNSVIMYLPFKK